MAHSIQTFGDKVEIFNDLDLLILLAFMLSELSEHTDRYPTLKSCVAVWEESLLAYAPGLLDLQLDDMASCAAGKEQLRQLLSVVERQLKQFGESVPASKLNLEWRVSGVRFHDYRTALVEDAINKLKKLVDGRPRTVEP